MKYVYVLVSGDSDCYAEQTYISMYSLRRFNPGCRIVLATDESTLKSMDGRCAGIKDFADETVLFEVPGNYTLLQRSRHIKTSIRRMIAGDFLYLDCDTLVLGPLDELEGLAGDVLAVRIQDRDRRPSDKADGMLRAYNCATGAEPDDNHGISDYYNGGVILARDTRGAHLLFDAWHRLWTESSVRYGFHKDQCALWIANKQNDNIMQAMDGKYNLQAICPNTALRYLDDCRIFHYLSSARFLKNFPLKSREALERLIDAAPSGGIDEVLDNIKTDYLNGLTIYTDPDALKWTDAPLVSIARKLSASFPVLDRAVAALYRLTHCCGR